MDGIVGIHGRGQIADYVLDLGPFVKTESSGDSIWDVETPEHLFKRSREDVGPIENSDGAFRTIPAVRPDPLDDKGGLLVRVAGLEVPDLLARAFRGPEILSLSLFVVGNNGARGRENRLGRPVILFQPNRPCVGIVFFEVENVLDVRAPPAIYRLIFVSDHTHVAVPVRQVAYQRVLRTVGVLILVDHDVAKSFAVAASHLRKLFEKLYGLAEKVIEIERIGFLETLLVVVVDACGLLPIRLKRILGHRFRADSPALR